VERNIVDIGPSAQRAQQRPSSVGDMQSESSQDRPRVIGRGVSARKFLSFAVRYVYAFFSCIFLFTVGVLRGRDRTLLYRIAAHFGPLEIEPYRPKPAIPETPISDVVGGNEGIHVFEPSGVFGNVTPLELIVINQLIRLYKPLRIFEIGTFDGRTTLNMAANSGRRATVYTLDLPQNEVANTGLPIALGDETYIRKEISGERFRETAYKRQIRQLFGDSATFDFSPYRGMIDFVFVDGAHSYDYVKSDSFRALDMLRDGQGVILWHDYGAWDGVTIAINELRNSEPQFEGIRHIAGTTLAGLIRARGNRKVSPKNTVKR
jgi:predicted O-methyltransferase YrrM